MPAHTLQTAPLRHPTSEAEPVAAPQAVEVRTRFDGRWTRGFELIGTDLDHEERPYILRRRSDHAILPITFSADEIRPVSGA